jgi:hypothetical protein
MEKADILLKIWLGLPASYGSISPYTEKVPVLCICSHIQAISNPVSCTFPEQHSLVRFSVTFSRRKSETDLYTVVGTAI